jgi:uncharacterized protein (DUF2384 family)
MDYICTVMKKPMQYSITKKGSKAQEPIVAYSTPLLSVLNGLSYQDIDTMHLSGSSLVDIQNQTLLSPRVISSIVGVSKSKYYDLIHLDDLGAKNIDALADFAALWQKGLDAFDGDVALLNEWLETRNSNLGDISPVELLSSRLGRRELEKAFLRIEYSTYG